MPNPAPRMVLSQRWGQRRSPGSLARTLEAQITTVQGPGRPSGPWDLMLRVHGDPAKVTARTPVEVGAWSGKVTATQPGLKQGARVEGPRLLG